MMGWEFLWLLLPIAAWSGYLIGRRGSERSSGQRFSQLSRTYFSGLNYLLNEQPDKAIEVFLKIAELAVAPPKRRGVLWWAGRIVGGSIRHRHWQLLGEDRIDGIQDNARDSEVDAAIRMSREAIHGVEHDAVEVLAADHGR